MEWVNRKKPVENVVYQPRQSIQPVCTGMLLTDQTQSTRAQIEALMDQRQVSQVRPLQNMQMLNVLQQCCVQWPAQYTPYYYGGCCGRNIEGAILERFY